MVSCTRDENVKATFADVSLTEQTEDPIVSLLSTYVAIAEPPGSAASGKFVPVMVIIELATPRPDIVEGTTIFGGKVIERGPASLLNNSNRRTDTNSLVPSMLDENVVLQRN
jgi:hypothetical protein